MIDGEEFAGTVPARRGFNRPQSAAKQPLKLYSQVWSGNQLIGVDFHRFNSITDREKSRYETPRKNLAENTLNETYPLDATDYERRQRQFTQSNADLSWFDARPRVTFEEQPTIINDEDVLSRISTDNRAIENLDESFDLRNQLDNTATTLVKRPTLTSTPLPRNNNENQENNSDHSTNSTKSYRTPTSSPPVEQQPMEYITRRGRRTKKKNYNEKEMADKAFGNDDESD